MSQRTSLIKIGSGLAVIVLSIYYGYKAGRNAVNLAEEKRENEQLQRVRLQEIQQYRNSQDLPQYSASNTEFNISNIFNSLSHRNFISPAARKILIKTVAYLTSGLAITVSTMFYLNSRRMSSSNNNSISRSKATVWLALIGTVIGALGTKWLPIRYNKLKHCFWLIFCVSNGVALAPLASLSGPILMKTALYSTVIVFGSSLLSIVVKKRSLIILCAPLIIGSSLLLASGLYDFIGFFSSTVRSNQPLLSLSQQFNLYGGLMVFAGYTMLDTQAIIDEAEEKNEILERRRLIRDAFNVVEYYQNHPNNSNNNNNHSNNARPEHRNEFPGVGHRLGSASEKTSNNTSTEPQPPNNPGPSNFANEINSGPSAPPVIQLPHTDVRPPPMNPEIYPVDDQENKSIPFDYDYPVKPGSNRSNTEINYFDPDEDLKVDCVGWSVDFYLDFLNIALKIVQEYIRQQQQREQQEQQQQQQQGRQNNHTEQKEE